MAQTRGRGRRRRMVRMEVMAGWYIVFLRGGLRGQGRKQAVMKVENGKVELMCICLSAESKTVLSATRERPRRLRGSERLNS